MPWERDPADSPSKTYEGERGHPTWSRPDLKPLLRPRGRKIRPGDNPLLYRGRRRIQPTVPVPGPAPKQLQAILRQRSLPTSKRAYSSTKWSGSGSATAWPGICRSDHLRPQGTSGCRHPFTRTNLQLFAGFRVSFLPSNRAVCPCLATGTDRAGEQNGSGDAGRKARQERETICSRARNCET